MSGTLFSNVNNIQSIIPNEIKLNLLVFFHNFYYGSEVMFVTIFFRKRSKEERIEKGKVDVI